ncbi:DUF6221 family protein [Actinosynnema sp. NPDC023587]|uniref:DUF6221 family protein n=1 Tax=Actinosynnema sp. NPDC023587 TaxID=3154695 RepID=UPI0033E27646
MVDLATQVLSAIDAAERDARAAAWKDADWVIAWQPVPKPDEEIPDPVVLADGKPIIRLHTEYAGHLAVDHVVRQDPTAALRRCAADRRTVERHRPVPDHGRFSDDWADNCPNPDDCAHYERPPVCTCCCDNTGDPVPAPCPDLLDRADAYGITAVARA